MALSVLDPEIVLLTDIEDVVPLLRENVQLNVFLNCTFPRNCYFSVPYRWGDPFHVYNMESMTTIVKDFSEYIDSCEVMILSDVVYDPCGYSPLVNSIYSFLVSCETLESSPTNYLQKKCILAHKHRHPDSYRYNRDKMSSIADEFLFILYSDFFNF